MNESLRLQAIVYAAAAVCRPDLIFWSCPELHSAFGCAVSRRYLPSRVDPRCTFLENRRIGGRDD